jgi:hypothetical protein
MELKPILRRRHGHERPVELSADLSEGRFLRGGAQHIADEAGLARPLEQRRQHVHHAVHDGPGEVAAEDADEERVIVRLLASEPHRADDAERHDQAEQDLAQPAGGIEVASDERAHGAPS